MYTDAHCHLTHPDWNGAMPEAINRARKGGITSWGLGGIEPKEWMSQIGLSTDETLNKAVWKAFGLHPWWVAKASAADIDAALKQLDEKLPQAKALGELGMDLHSHPETRAAQEAAFGRQLDLAKKHKKPLVLHVVKGHTEVLKGLKARNKTWKGIVHRFSGNIAEAQAYTDLGLTLSIGGPDILRQARTHGGLWRSIPLSNLVLETDAPWKDTSVALEDQLAFLKEIARTVGEAIQFPADKLLATARKNLEGIFGTL